MHLWFFSYNGQQMGPLDQAAAVAQAAKDANGHCWRQGFAEWQAIASCMEIRAETAAGSMAIPAPPNAHQQRA